MNLQYLLVGIGCFFVAHFLTFYQLNGQFLQNTDWFRDNIFIVAGFGILLSFLYIWGTRYTVMGMDGLLWPARFIGFGIGMLLYGVLVSYHFNQGFSLKVAVSLLLCLALISIQVLWKE